MGARNDVSSLFRPRAFFVRRLHMGFQIGGTGFVERGFAFVSLRGEVNQIRKICEPIRFLPLFLLVLQTNVFWRSTLVYVV